jgi:hypothetical protein
MSDKTDFLNDLLSPSFWEENMKTPFDSIQKSISNSWNSFCDDVEIVLKLLILIFYPKLATIFWPAKNYIRN